MWTSDSYSFWALFLLVVALYLDILTFLPSCWVPGGLADGALLRN